MRAGSGSCAEPGLFLGVCVFNIFLNPGFARDLDPVQVVQKLGARAFKHISNPVLHGIRIPCGTGVKQLGVRIENTLRLRKHGLSARGG